ncbi:hypothetical protein P7C70_g1305, partial [Phenoliferia sp. Uapishka_3]
MMSRQLSLRSASSTPSTSSAPSRPLSRPITPAANGPTASRSSAFPTQSSNLPVPVARSTRPRRDSQPRSEPTVLSKTVRKRGATNDPSTTSTSPCVSSPSAAAGSSTSITSTKATILSTAPPPRPSRTHLTAGRPRSRSKSPRHHLTRSVSGGTGSCPEPRRTPGAAVGGPSLLMVSRIMAEGEVGGAGDRKAGEMLSDLRDGRNVDGRSVKSNEECGCQEDELLQALLAQSSQAIPYVFDCTMPVPLPDPLPSASLPSPCSSPSYRSPLLRPSPLRIISSPTHMPFSALNGVSTDSQYSPSPTGSVSSFLSLDAGKSRSRNSSSNTSSNNKKDESKRRRRGSTQPRLDPVQHTSAAAASRPQLHTYTSFEAAFDIHPPPSPPPSPKVEGKSSWWSLGA